MHLFWEAIKSRKTSDVIERIVQHAAHVVHVTVVIVTNNDMMCRGTHPLRPMRSFSASPFSWPHNKKHFLHGRWIEREKNVCLNISLF